ncbi:rhomboid family intramembrane serine protease [Nocardioides sp. SYSU D00065]|uniref:rhomboid family intramembrane serine protease n=1 Tax=Nocardioides sp. SYSU D00065 TaxID=2817378 RepID=UPI001B33687B|nr:rhomboid family intramembrane serine protease [Nocardioides sp. SYSU D00065]
MTQPTDDPAATGVPTCYRHPDRETWIRCQRCDRPICPDCMRDAAVGFQCPECVKEANKGSRQNRALYGGERSADPRLTTYVLMGISAVVWLAVTLGGSGSRLADLLSLTPGGRCELLDGSGRYYPGVVEQAACATLPGAGWHEGVASGAWWQMVTSMFTHVDLWHLALNLMAIYILGPALEGIMGRVRFLMVYLVGGLAGSVLVLWLSDSQGSTLGASGALYAILGGLLVTFRKARLDTQWLMQNLALGVVITVVGWRYISWQGHLGGLLGGMAVAAIIAYAPKSRRSAVQWGGVGLVTAVLVGLSLVRVGMLT